MQPVRGVLFAWYFQVSGLYLPEPEIAVTALDGLMRLRVRGDDHTSTSADLPLRLGAGERAAVTVRQSQTGDRRRVRLTIGNGSATVETVRHLPTYALRSYLLKGKDHGHPKEDYSPPFAFTARIRDFHVRRV